MRSTRSTIAVLSACAVLAGCSSAPVDSAPVVRITEAAKPSMSRPLNQVLPAGDELTTALEDWIKTWNANARPFRWTKTADQIIDRIGRYCSRISGPAH